MCGRYSLARREMPWAFQEVGVTWDGASRYNVGPMQRAPVIRRREGRASIEELRWGLIPGWAKDTRIAARCINARAETVAEMPAFRAAFRSRRCLIPADGFYEWQVDGRQRLPWRFVRRDQQPLLFAGLWERWTPESNPEVCEETFTLLTTTPNAEASRIHDRMPVVLQGESATRWLEPETGIDALRSMCLPMADGELEIFRVSPMVNSVRNDSEECLRRVVAQAELEF